MKITSLWATSVLLVVLSCALPAVAQQAAAIEISGDVQKPMIVTDADLAAMPRVTASIGDVSYSGVLLGEVLKRAGVPSGSELRGKALTTYVMVEAQDGYQVVFSLGELDPSVSEGPILLADSSNGKPLSGTDGSFRLVIPKDKVGARSVRMLTKLTVVQLEK